jgi:hypothetical protein
MASSNVESRIETDTSSRAAYVILECVAEGSKLRVKMKSPGYLINSNCQFPRDLRLAGRKFKVPVEDVKLMTQRGKYFYSIKKKTNIEIIENSDSSDSSNIAAEILRDNLKHMKIYEDADTSDCAVCLSDVKSIVFIPCGHFYTCNLCSQRLKTCPICRETISECVDKNLFD